MSASVYSLDENYPKSSVEALAKTNAERLQQTYEDLFGNNENGKKIEKLVKETREMIPQIDTRIHYWEARRTQFLQLSIGIMAAALAGIVALFPQIISIFENSLYFSLSSFIYIPVSVLSIVLLIGCTKILILWNQQNNPPYPFTKGTRTWRWQYRHAEKNPTDTDFQNYNNQTFQKQIEIFADNLIEYKIKTITSDEKELLDQDLSQLYLLLINEKYKIKFVSKLRDILIKSLGEAALLAIGVSVIMVVLRLITSYIQIT